MRAEPSLTPYRASHAIFVRESAERAYEGINEILEPLRARTISLHAFDDSGEMVGADLVDGRELESLIERLLANPEVSHLRAHYAKRGCYAARIERA